MRMIISPAKKMNVDMDSFLYKELPRFLSKTEELRSILRDMTDSELKKLWKCNDQIAALNMERLQNMDLHNHLTPALLGTPSGVTALQMLSLRKQIASLTLLPRSIVFVCQNFCLRIFASSLACSVKKKTAR